MNLVITFADYRGYLFLNRKLIKDKVMLKNPIAKGYIICLDERIKIQ